MTYKNYRKTVVIRLWNSLCVWGRELPQGQLITHDSADFYLKHIYVSKIWLDKAKEGLQLCSRRHLLVVISKIASLNIIQIRESDDFHGMEELK